MSTASALTSHERVLWAVAYRMTGVAADADDVVQETFARALAHPPRGDRPLRPWLVKVAMNVARDKLRRRRRRAYVGPWLPSPVDDDALDVPDAAPGPEQRYSLRESATFAFLIAVEALTPLRRAVLILRDVFDYSGEETARALGISTDAVKQNLSRARRALAGYDAAREPLELKTARNDQALARLFFALAGGDAGAVEELLADDVEAHGDGGGVYAAARVVLHGREKVALVYRNLTRLTARYGRSAMELRRMNGAASAVITLEQDAPRPHVAPLMMISVDTDATGKIVRIYAVTAPKKLVRRRGAPDACR